jgi:hypothetical protein
MARFAHVKFVVLCPGCGSELAPGGVIGIQWGYCPNPHGGPYFTYEVGEPLLWCLDKRGEVPAWAYFRDGSANVGDPSFPNLVIRESEYGIRACRGCRHRIEGLGVVIVGGVIAEVRVDEEPGGILECDVITLDSNGVQTPRPEWDDHPMITGVDGGWRTRLIEMPRLLSRDLSH